MDVGNGNAADDETHRSRSPGGGTASDDAAATTPPPSEASAPRPTWRKRPSQKGKTRLKLAKHDIPWPPTMEKPATRAQQTKRRAGDDVGGERPAAARRKLDLGGEEMALPSASSATLICFGRAMLVFNLRSLSKLVLSDDGDDDDEPSGAAPPVPSPGDSSSFSSLCPPLFVRAEVMDGLRSLAKRHDLPAAATALVVVSGCDQRKSGTRKPTMVDRLVLVPYRSRKLDDEAIAMALVAREGATGRSTYVPRWSTEELVPLPKAQAAGRGLVEGIDAATLAVYDELMRREETCLGDDLGGDVPGGDEWDERRREFELRVDYFMDKVRKIIGDRKFSPWGGSVVTSVVGTFLTQNVTDNMSSTAFMNIVAKFSSKNNDNVAQSSDVPLITSGGDEHCHLMKPLVDCSSGGAEPGDAGFANQGKHRDKDLEEIMASIRRGDVSSWDNDTMMKVLRDRFGNSTGDKIFKDIVNAKDTSHWNDMLDEAYKNGYIKEIRDDMVDWEAVMHAPFADVEDCIRERGQHCQMAFRILAFLIRMKRDHGSIDLEWLRYIPRAKAMKYLLGINGLGAKSVDCIRLLSLRHRAFPVDTNVARIVTRLGWVKLQSLPSSQEFHLVDKYPIMPDIQTYLEPLLCKIDAPKLYELHCQMITFGKTICTKRRPNCGACPFTADCTYYKSLYGRAVSALPEYSQQDGTWQTNMYKDKTHLYLVKLSFERMHQYQIEEGKSTEQHCNDPIVELPPSPPHEYSETSSEEEEESEYNFVPDIEDIVPPAIKDLVPDYDMEIDLRPIKHAEMTAHGKDMIAINPRTYSTRLHKQYYQRTEYTAYIIPDGHSILDKFDRRVPADRNPYMLIIRSFDEYNVKATILIPCRTANRGSFPLNGTYFSDNEVFADHLSSRSPIVISRESIWNFDKCIVNFGTSIHSVTKGQTEEGLCHFFNTGYICTREFDRDSKYPQVLSEQIHDTNVNKEIGKKRYRKYSNLN